MYATAQDLVDRFGEEELTDRTDRAGTGAYDTDTVSRALADGWGEVETYLLDRYPEMTDGSLVRADVPAKVVALQCDLARARLWDDATNEVVDKNEKAAIRFLERVADGKQLLRTPVRQTAPGTSAGVSIARGRNRHGDGSLRRFEGL